MPKYTDEQIKKALECCNNGSCIGCPFHCGSSTCLANLQRAALDLINRQEAEIEKLRDERQYLRSKIGLLHGLEYITHTQVLGEDFLILSKEANGYEKLSTFIESKAIKEFAERLKEKFGNLEQTIRTDRKTIPVELAKAETDAILQIGCPKIIDNLVKEMVGEAE